MIRGPTPPSRPIAMLNNNRQSKDHEQHDFHSTEANLIYLHHKEFRNARRNYHEQCTFHSKLTVQPFILTTKFSGLTYWLQRQTGPIVHRQPFLANLVSQCHLCNFEPKQPAQPSDSKFNACWPCKSSHLPEQLNCRAVSTMLL